jgi:hypothetical protein
MSGRSMVINDSACMGVWKALLLDDQTLGYLLLSMVAYKITKAMINYKEQL